MQPSEAIEDEREALRHELVNLVQRLIDQARAFDLPAPPSMLAEYRQRLQHDSYTVLVAGEARRGKSSFVNALIGRPLLPAGLEIATAQAFLVGHAEQPAARLRFEDGSERPIELDQLVRYGALATDAAAGTPDPGQVLRWIEVEVPLRFLPPGMNLLDTPGLGSLHAGHAQITRRFVPRADAVIYALDSSRPAGRDDLAFIDAILNITRRIFFIQTMIDQQSRAHWQELQRRNQTILAERYGDRLADTRVWPISNTLLLEGARAGDDDLVRASRQQELVTALRAFLFRVAGADRMAEALSLAGRYHQHGGKVLAARLAALGEESRAQGTTMRERAAQHTQRFEAEWGERGQQRNELREAIRRALAVGKQGFSQALGPGGSIATAWEEKIEALKSVQEARALGERLAGEVVAAASDAWEQTCSQVQTRCLGLLEPFLASALALDVAHDPQLGAVVPGKLNAEFKDDWWMRLRGLYSHAAVMIGLSHFFPPLAPLVPLAAIWVIARGGWKESGTMQIKAAQQELRKYLSQVLQQLRRHFFEVDLARGRLGLVDEYFAERERALLDAVRDVVQQRSDQARGELARMTDAARLDEGQRRQRAEQIKQQQLPEWERTGAAFQALTARLPRTAPPPPAGRDTPQR